MNNKAVILGTNYYIGLSIARCLGKNGVHVTAVDYEDKGAYGRKSRYISERLIAPNFKENPDGLLEFLINYAKSQECPPILYPSADQYVEYMDKYGEELHEYFLFPENEKGLCESLMNKESIHKMAVDLGVAVPETIRVTDENYLERVKSEIGYPCLIKPTNSPAFVDKFRKKLFIAESQSELLKYIVMADEAELEVIIQRIIPGFDDHMHTFDAYMNKNSDVTHYVTCQKFRQYPINYGASVFTRQKHFPELYEIGKKFFKGCKFQGFAEIEFKKDEKSGKFYLIEANIRTTNLNSMLCKAGINFPMCTYMEMTGKPLPDKFIETDTGYVFWYAFEDFFACRDYVKSGQLKRKEIICSVLKSKKVGAVWSMDDPMPALSFLSGKIGRVFSKITHIKK